jgi:hypothetical protein
VGIEIVNSVFTTAAPIAFLSVQLKQAFCEAVFSSSSRRICTPPFGRAFFSARMMRATDVREMLKVREISFRLWPWMWWRKIEARGCQNEKTTTSGLRPVCADVTPFELGPAHTRLHPLDDQVAFERNFPTSKARVQSGCN